MPGDGPLMEFQREIVDRASEVGVQSEFLLFLEEVVIGLRLLKLTLTVPPDHDERRQEDRLEGNGERQRRPRARSTTIIQVTNTTMWT